MRMEILDTPYKLTDTRTPIRDIYWFENVIPYYYAKYRFGTNSGLEVSLLLAIPIDLLVNGNFPFHLKRLYLVCNQKFANQ